MSQLFFSVSVLKMPDPRNVPLFLETKSAPGAMMRAVMSSALLPLSPKIRPLPIWYMTRFAGSLLNAVKLASKITFPFTITVAGPLNDRFALIVSDVNQYVPPPSTVFELTA